MSSLLTPLAILAVSMVVSGAVVIAVRRKVPLKVLQSHNEGIENYLVILSALYGIMTAFVILDLWAQHRAAEVNTVQESNAATAIFRLGRSFPSPQREQILDATQVYVRGVIDTEWDLMLAENASKQSHSRVDQLSIEYPLLDRVWDPLVSAQPGTETQKSIQAQAIARYEDLLAARRTRLLDSEKRVVPYVGLLLVLGGLFTAICMLYIGMENAWSQVLLTGMCVGFIALMLFVVHDLENPFRGSWAVGKESYSLALRRMESVRAGDAAERREATCCLASSPPSDDRRRARTTP
jgi:hypothetical protein